MAYIIILCRSADLRAQTELQVAQDLFHEAIQLLRREHPFGDLGVHMAVEMVDLVQEAAGDDILALIFVPVAVPVLCADDNVLGTGDDAVFAGRAGDFPFMRIFADF